MRSILVFFTSCAKSREDDLRDLFPHIWLNSIVNFQSKVLLGGFHWWFKCDFGRERILEKSKK